LLTDLIAIASTLLGVLDEGCGIMSVSFALLQDIQPQSFAFAMDLGAVLRQLLQEVQDLRAENQRLTTKVEALEALHELYHGPIPAKGDWPGLSEALARQKDASVGVSEQDIQFQDQGLDTTAKKDTKPKGKKTMQRIEKLKELLIGYGGYQTFEQLQIDLNLSSSQFSQLVRKLDKRVFEVVYLPGGKKGEKVLTLKAMI